jgi:catechol 2,3-dioxygenase-like lactoylglutathione lyase family enzyme
MSMKRLHLSLNVSDLEASIAFYSSLFAEQPSVVHEDYAKWLLEDPRVNFVIEQATPETAGLTHAGIQAADSAELQGLYDRMAGTDAPWTGQGRTTCCYAESDKGWTTSPDGLPWEAFLTHRQTDVRRAAPSAAPCCVEAACCG